MRLGLKPVVHDPRTLRLSTYLTPALPDPPASCDWTPRVPGWLMYANDRYGCCAYAAAAETIRILTSNDAPYECRTPPEEQVVKEYFDASPNDQGIVMLDMLRKWRRDRILSDTISAFTSVRLRDHRLVCAATSLFGHLLLGMNLPVAVDAQHGLPDWKSPSDFHRGFFGRHNNADWEPGSWGGHAVVVAKYDATGMWVVTWGGLKFMDWAFYDTYAMEAYVVFGPDWLGGDGKSPNGLDIGMLSHDLYKLN